MGEACEGNVCTECCEGHSDAEKFQMDGNFSCQECDEADCGEACAPCFYQHGMDLCKECCDAHYKCPDCDKMFDYVCDCTKCNGCCECDNWVPEVDKKTKAKKSKKRVGKRTEKTFSKKSKQKRSRKK